jgi:hypothetical protein
MKQKAGLPLAIFGHALVACGYGGKLLRFLKSRSIKFRSL